MDGDWEVPLVIGAARGKGLYDVGDDNDVDIEDDGGEADAEVNTVCERVAWASWEA